MTKRALAPGSALADALPQPVWTARPEGAVDYANPAWRAYTGLSPEASLGGGWAAAVHPDDVAAIEDAFGAASEQGTPYEVEYRFRRADGVYRWHLARVAPLRDASGAVAGWVGAAIDVDERRRAEADQARLAAIVASSWDAIVGRDLEGRITSWNPGAERLYGYAAEEVLGRDVKLLVSPERRGELADLTARLGRGERIPPFETVRLRKDGTPVDVEMALSPILDAAGRPLGVAAIARDIRQRRTAERQQQELLEAVSHDLKNPLGVVRGQAQLLGRRIRRGAVPDAEGLARALASIVAATTRMADQLDELQDAARLRAGAALELRADPVDLTALAEAAVTDAQAATARHRLRVAAGGAAIVGRWDRMRLRRVLDNVLGNAVKYSPAGGEIVVAVHREDRAGGAHAVLSVRDQGVGIPAADLPHVFERYRRGSNVGTRTRGTGIGLAGARQIVEQHGGTITVASEEGRGSTVTVDLPLMPPAEPCGESDHALPRP